MVNEHEKADHQTNTGTHNMTAPNSNTELADRLDAIAQRLQSVAEVSAWDIGEIRAASLALRGGALAYTEKQISPYKEVEVALVTQPCSLCPARRVVDVATHTQSGAEASTNRGGNVDEGVNAEANKARRVARNGET